MSFRSVITSAAVVLALAATLRADDFYEQQLQIGKIDAAAGRTVQAADELRIAAFGFLDRPPLLVEALARLALAQSALGQANLVTQTLGRFVDVEQRFDVYPAALDSATRTKFEALLLKNVQPSTLKTIPTLAKLLKSPVDAAAELPPRQRIAAYEAGARREPQNIDWPLALMHLYADGGEPREIARWSQRVLALDPKNSEARALLVHAYESQGSCREALPVFATMTAADLHAHPDAYADAGVCLTEAGRISDAKAAFAKAPDSTKSRGDVRKAIDTIAKRDASDAAAAKAAAEKVAADKAAAEKAAAEKKAAEKAAADKKAAEKAAADKAAEKAAAAQGTPEKAATNPANLPAPPKIAAAPPEAQADTGQRSQRSATPGQEVQRHSAEVLAQARALIRDGKAADALQQLRVALQSDPENRLLRLGILESAVLSKQWPMAAAQVFVTSPYSAGEELSMFYAGVAMYETGNLTEAKALMQRARSRMASSPLVDYYMNAVLGE